MKHSYKHSSGHTLVELLVVMSIMALLATLVSLGAQSLTAAGFTEEIYDFNGVFDQARSYAIANNTYVFVGIQEVDGNQPAGATPQAAGVGKVAVAVVASSTGTKLYDAGAWTTTNPSNLNIVVPLKTFSNLHLQDFSGLNAASGGMVRPSVSAQESISSATCPTTSYTFNWPLLGTTPQYTFQNVVQFDPTGQATLLPNTYSLSSSGIITTLELGLLPAHGDVAAPVPTDIAVGNQAALQIDGVTGAVQLYQP